jgi:RNA polymerase sigma-70 factor (ECF subfamily)
MSSQGSFTDLMHRLRAGEERAAWEVFQRYTRRLIGLARRQFDTALLRRVDPEDVVQSVYKSFFLRCEEGQFDLGDWAELWYLLAAITRRKCYNQIQHHLRGCRDLGREVPLPAAESDVDLLSADTLDREPSPPEAILLTELVDGLLRDLDPPERQIVELSLQGYTPAEIKQQVNRSERTVRRVRERVRMRLERLQVGE